MSEITTYVGKPGSGKTLVLQEIARKELLNENSVLVIATEKFDLNPLSSGELTIVYNDDIEQVIRAYEIIHSGFLPEVVVVDKTELTASEVSFIINFRVRGVKFHLGVHSRRSNIREVVEIRSDLTCASDVIYNVEKAVSLSGEPRVVIVPVKSRKEESQIVVIGGYRD
jgi:stage III sporulation protein SpoIIIAA